jgi:hypothetical protein
MSGFISLCMIFLKNIINRELRFAIDLKTKPAISCEEIETLATRYVCQH